MTGTNHHAEEALHQLERRFGPRELTVDVLDHLLTPGPRYRSAVMVLALVLAAGVLAFVVRLVTVGLGHRAEWGYLAATFSYVLTTAQAAPLLALGLRFVKADWRRELTRASELFTVAGIVSVLVYIPLLLTLPPIEGRRSMWFNWPFGAPWLYDTVALVLLAVHGLAILYVSAIPDFAVARDYFSGRRREFYARLALGWAGTPKQWTVLYFGLIILGAFYAMMLAYVHWIIPVDFAMSLVPGWVSSIFPAYHMLMAMQSAVALNLIALFLWRRNGGLGRYLWLDHFWGPAKLLLALSLLWFYMFWADFLTHWYGRTPREQAVLQLLIFGPYFVPWLLAFLLSFVVPFLSLIFNKVRVSMVGPVVVSISPLVGNFFNEVRFYVSAFSIEDVTAHQLEHIPPGRAPDVLDLLMIAGVFAAVTLLYLVASKIVPPLAMWELKEGLLLRVRRRFLRREYVVVAKPR